MTSFDPKRYKHLPKFRHFVYSCHFPNKSVNHSETSYAIPEDYKNDNDFLQHYRSLRLSCNTDTDYIGAFPHFYYVVDLYEAIAYNRPRPDPTPYIQRGNAYYSSHQQLPPQPTQIVRNYQYIVSKPIACMLGGGKAPRLSEAHCDRDSVCVKTGF